MAVLGRPGDQLSLFASANDIVQSLYSGKIGSHESEFHSEDGGIPAPGTEAEREAHISLMNAKKGEATKPFKYDEHGSGVYDSISEKGFQGHVQLDVSQNRPRIWEGHHRLGAAHDLGEQFVGLDYVDPAGKYGAHEYAKPSYEERYPQNGNDWDTYWT